jgi:hypothetical protein
LTGEKTVAPKKKDGEEFLKFRNGKAGHGCVHNLRGGQQGNGMRADPGEQHHDFLIPFLVMFFLKAKRNKADEGEGPLRLVPPLNF